MNKIKDFVLRIYNLCKDWVVANGIEGVVGLLLGLFLDIKMNWIVEVLK